jgi:KEOPS complex subunit Cgi121
METPREKYEIRKARITIDDRNQFLQIIQGVARLHSLHIICFDADKMAGRDHAKAAIHHSQRSFFSGRPISNSFEMEALLFAAGTRQCQVAASFGIKEGENSMFVCVYPVNEHVWPDLSRNMHFVDEMCDDMTPQKEERLVSLFNITPEELEIVGRDRIIDLILERIALLYVNR